MNRNQAQLGKGAAPVYIARLDAWFPRAVVIRGIQRTTSLAKALGVPSCEAGSGSATKSGGFAGVCIGIAIASLFSAAHSQPVSTPQDYKRSSGFEYHTSGPLTGLLRIERVEPNSPSQCVETEYSYDEYGNKTGSTTRNCTNAGGAGASGNAAFTARSSASGYAGYSLTVKGVAVTVPAGTFARTSTNAVGHSETRTIDPRFGAVVSLTGPNGLTTGYELDDWGRVLRENRADGSSTRSLHCLISGRVSNTASNSAGCGATGPLSGRSEEIPSGRSGYDGWRAVSYVQVQSFDANNSPMGPAQRVYKDAEGRAIREITQGFDGGSQSSNHRWIVKDTVYNAHGVAVASTGTYFLESGSPSTGGSNDMALTTTVVDTLGRPLQIYQRDPKGSSSASFGPYGTHPSSRTLVSYSGLVTTTTTDRGQTRVEEKNPNGLLVRVTDATGAQLAHQHDAFGNLLATKDALQNTISLSYDTRGRKLSMQDPSTGLWTYDYNALGELVWQQSPNQRAQAQATTMAYDRLGRMTTRTSPEYSSSWTYDSCSKGVGKLCASSTTHGVAKSFAYDHLGRPTGSRMAVSNGPSFNTALSYDSKGRVDTQTYPTGLQVRYAYTASGFLNQVLLPQAVAITPDRQAGQSGGAASAASSNRVLWTAGSLNARGQSESSSLGNGLTSRASFDGPGGRIEALSVGAGNATNVAHHSYVWDSIGNLQSRVDHNGDGLTGAVTDTYGYDALNRLVQYKVEAVNAANLTRTVDLHYNAIGNLLYKSDVGNYSYANFGGGSVRPHAVAQVALAHETRVYGYDANGNAISASAGPWRSISYTSFNLPDSNQGAQGPNGLKTTWFYDENHQRIRETRQNGQGTRTTWFLHPDNQGGLGFETESRNGSPDLNRHYVNAGGQMVLIVTRQALSSYASSGQASVPVVASLTTVKVEFWHKDHLGSTIATSDHAGTVTARYAYDPFGKRRQANGQYDPHGTLVIDWVDGSNTGTDRGYTGHEHHDELGLIHMNGRLFDPTLARFLQTDPFIQAMEELQNYNRYTYCYNNPLVCTDPSGLIFKWIAKKWREEVWRSPIGRAVLGIAAAAIMGPMGGTELLFGISNKFAVAAVAGFAGGAVSTGNLEGALQGAFSGLVFAGVGSIVGDAGLNKAGDIINASKFAGAVMLHGVAGCVTAVAGGGKCGPGALSAAFSKAALPITAGLSDGLGRALAQAVVGGTGSVLGGGKFENGAVTGAFGYIFNYCSSGKCTSKFEQFMYDWWPGYKAGTLLYNQTMGDGSWTGWEVVDAASVGLGVAAKGFQLLGTAAREIQLVDGFYQAEGSAFKFSKYYYERLWATGRGAPFIQAQEVLSTATTVAPDRMAGFYRYTNTAMEMVYNPTTKEVWHLQPLKK
jgi:RHS repeat-associated protein